MTPKERDRSLAVLKEAVIVASRHGQQMLDECNNSTAVSATAAAIILSTFCSASGMSMHDAMGLFMSVHKQTEAMAGDKS